MKIRTIVANALVIVVCSALFAVAQEKKSADSLVNEGFELMKANQFDSAISRFQEAIKLDPKSSEAHRQLGATLSILKRIHEAQQYLEKAVELDPNSPMAYLNLGNNLMSLRRIDEALTAYNTGKNLRPSDGRFDNALGLVMYSVGRFEEALPHYLKASERLPNSAGYAFNAGLTYVRLGRAADAIPLLEKAVRLDPDFRNAWFHLGHSYSATRRFRESVKAWATMEQLDPGNHDFLAKQAWNHLYGGFRKEAAENAETYFRKYGWKTSSSPFVALVGAISYKSLGMDSEAGSVITRALSNCDKSVWAYNLLKFWDQQLTGDELLALAVDNDKKTEAHTYIGVYRTLFGKAEGAKANFEWVKSFGNRQFYEYPLALLELERLPK